MMKQRIFFLGRWALLHGLFTIAYFSLFFLATATASYTLDSSSTGVKFLDRPTLPNAREIMLFASVGMLGISVASLVWLGHRKISLREVMFFTTITSVLFTCAFTDDQKLQFGVAMALSIVSFLSPFFHPYLEQNKGA